MVDFTDAANALRAHLAGNFAALPLVWPNSGDAPPVDGFVYSEIRLTGEGPISIGQDGARWHRDTGELAIYIYVPRHSLTGTAEAHAQTLRNLFKPNAVEGVKITGRTIGAGKLVESPAGNYWSIPVFVSWFADRKE